MIELFTIAVGTKMVFGWHWRRESFVVLHTELLQAIFEILLLRYEDAVALLSYLKIEKELQLSHHRHLIFFTHHIGKFISVTLVSTAKNDIININLAHKQITITCLCKKSWIGFPNLESISN